MTDLTEEYLAEFARDQQVDAWNHQQRGGNRCPSCIHAFRGLPCVAGSANAPCPCPSSLEAAS